MDGIHTRAQSSSRAVERAVANLQFDNVLALGFELAGNGQYIESRFSAKSLGKTT